MTATDANPYPRIKAYEQREIERLDRYLQALEPQGWVEQSYCTDWLVYQVVSHIGSGSRIGGQRVKAWTGSDTPVTRESMQQVWGHFDSLGPEQMYAAFSEAVREYLAVESATPDDAGTQEVDGFAGKRPLYAYQLSRTWELACHAWDVYVSRDRSARLDADAVALLGENLQFVNLPMDKDRAPTTPVAFELSGSGRTYVLEPGMERPRLAPGGDAPLIIAGPDEEIVRFISGRHFVPGGYAELHVKQGEAEGLTKLRRAFR